MLVDLADVRAVLRERSNGRCTVTPIAIVQYLDYRRHDQARADANNAIMALLAGAHLAAHSLQLTQGSAHLLPEIYPNVPHIQRFNLLTTRAQELLGEAEDHLSAMAVPYVLAIHEDFVLTSLGLLGKPTKGAVASNMHQRLADAVSANYGPALASFHAARILRNCIIHNGGEWDDRAAKDATKYMNPTDSTEWVRHTHRSILKLRPGDTVTIGHGELVATLSATKSLARSINHALQPALPRSRWAEILIDDIRVSEPAHLTDPRRLRKCSGYARHLYGPLQLTNDEISTALAKAGY